MMAIQKAVLHAAYTQLKKKLTMIAACQRGCYAEHNPSKCVIVKNMSDETIPMPLILYESGAFLAREYHQPHANKIALSK